MPSNSHPFIAKEGWLLLFVLAGLVFLAFNYISSTIAFILVTVFCIFLFLLRDPQRTIPSLPLAIVSPVEGQVIEIDETDDPWTSKQGLNRQTRRVRLKMSSLDVTLSVAPLKAR